MSATPDMNQEANVTNKGKKIEETEASTYTICEYLYSGHTRLSTQGLGS